MDISNKNNTLDAMKVINTYNHENLSKILFEYGDIKKSKKISEDLLGIGIRIEDDIVCTDDEPINLTEEAPKSIEDVEAICS